MKTQYPSSCNHSSGRSGYLLFEVILALTVFSVAVLGLANALNSGIETANILNRDNAVRISMRSFIEEIRRKPMAEMTAQVFDERLQTTLTSTVEPLTLKDRDNAVLSDLYVLHIKATSGEGNDAREESVDLYIYKPAETTEGSTQGGQTTTTAP